MKLISLKNRIGADNRRHLSANGFSLLPLALRPRLFCWAGVASVATILLLVGVMIVPPMPIMQTYADEPTPAADPSITVTTAGTIALDLMPTSSSGTFAKSTAGEFSVTTTNATGYTLKLKSVAANGTDLKYTYNNDTYTIPTLAANTGISEADFSNSNNAQYNNKWGYLPSKLNSTVNTTYKPAPSTDGDIIDVTEEANSTANDYSVTLGVKADYSVKPGSYTNTFVIEATANVVLDNLLTINFNGNGLLFPNSSATNTVKYDSNSIVEVQHEKYAHSDNFEDGSDVPVGGVVYPFDEESLKSVAINGAAYLEVDLKYFMDDGNGLFVLGGEYDENDFSASDFYEISLTGCDDGEYGDGFVECLNDLLDMNGIMVYGAYYGDGTFDDDIRETNLTIDDSAVTFLFYGTIANYGYYATVVGHDTNDDPIEVDTNIIYDRTLDSGDYDTPVVASGQYFYGWDTNPYVGIPTYTSIEDVEANMPGNNGDTVTLYAVYSTCPVGKICYNSNNASSTTTMANQTIETSGSTTFWASNFWRTGYGFAGWNTRADGSGVSYGPNETVSIADTMSLTLYAKWVASAGNLQGWSCPNNTNMPIGTVTALTDTRDNQVYAVAKLADSNCWMIENLRLNTAGSNDSTKAQGFGGVFSGLASAESTNFSNSTAANSLYSTTNITGSNQSYRFPRYNNINLSNLNTAVSGSDDSIYGYGNYYTWTAALANTNNYTSSTAQVDGKTSETVNTSICPAGWRLPYGRSTGNGNTSGGFYYLNYKLNNDSNVTDSTASNNLRSYPNNFVYSGRLVNSSAGARGGYGLYWSSTAYNSYGAYYLYLDPGAVGPGTGYDVKYYGLSVRCVLGS